MIGPMEGRRRRQRAMKYPRPAARMITMMPAIAAPAIMPGDICFDVDVGAFEGLFAYVGDRIALTC